MDASSLEYYKNLVAEAREGRGRVVLRDQEAFDTCIKAYDRIVEILRDEKKTCVFKAQRGCFGTFPSGIQLGQGYSRKAQGTPASYFAQLELHIEAAHYIQEWFRVSNETFAAVEAANKQRILDSGGQLPE